MKKEIILLAASKKHKNLCVAGIDTSTGQWIRIVSEDSTISYAIKSEDAIYEDESLPELLDIIEIQCRGRQSSYYQAENYINNPEYYWKNIGRAEIKEILKIHPLENEDYIFYNAENKVHKDYILALNDEKDKNSLMLIAPTNITIHVQQWERKKVKMSFLYKGIKYRYLAVTDIDFEQRYLAMEPNDYSLTNGTVLVISLGECYNDYHSKLIATIIE